MEDILIPVIVFSSLLLFLKMVLDYARFRHEHKVGSRQLTDSTESNSLRVSELENMIQNAVDGAVSPLERRLRRLERNRPTDSVAAPEMHDPDAASQDLELDAEEIEPPLSSRGGNVYDVGASRPRVRRH